MTYKPSMAEAQAMGLCLLSRLPGLPDVPTLRGAVAQMHPTICGWCAPVKDEKTGKVGPSYPDDELQRILRVFNGTRSQFDDDRWNGLPARAKGEAIRMAQGREDVA